jgi:hypothetical protein
MRIKRSQASFDVLQNNLKTKTSTSWQCLPDTLNMPTETRFICLSDTHLANPNPDDEAFFPGFMRKQHPMKRDKMYYDAVSLMNKCFIEVTRIIRDYEPPFEALIHLGDLTSGAHERGIGSGNVTPLALTAFNHLKSVSPDVKIDFGNHDAGYFDSEVDLDSLLACQLIAPLWWTKTFAHSDVLVIGICSGILPKVHKYKLHSMVRERQDAQLDFVAEALRMHRGRPWVLCTHDPDVSGLEKVAAPYVRDLLHMIYGDQHNPSRHMLQRLKGIGKSITRSGGPFARACLLRGKLCPSVAPLWWQGMQYARVTLTGERGFQFQLIQPNAGRLLDQEIRQFRWSHFSNCAYDVALEMGRRNWKRFKERWIRKKKLPAQP